MNNLADVLWRRGVEVRTLSPLVEVDGETIYRLPVQASDAISTWSRLRELVTETGYTPVILGSVGKEPQIAEAHDYDRVTWEPTRVLTTADLLAKASAIDVHDWFERERRMLCQEISEVMEDVQEDGTLEELARLEAIMAQPEEVRGFPPPAEWPEPESPSTPPHTPQCNTLLEITGSVSLGLVPTPYSWQVPVYFRWHGGDVCPNPDANAAVLKHWHELYGAEVLCLTWNVLEVWANRPPATRADALSLAREQYLYCYRFDGGYMTGNLEYEAAALLWNRRLWWFWWD